MKINVYCLKDDYLGFQTPFCSMNDAAACRDFENLICKPDTVYSMHKDLFNLYKIGIFDSESGEIDSKVEFIQSGSTYIREEK